MFQTSNQLLYDEFLNKNQTAAASDDFAIFCTAI